MRTTELFFGPGFKDFDKFFVGFDAHFDHLNTLAEAVTRNSTGYPPYNILKLAENDYRIDVAVAGFDQNELEIEVVAGQLSVRGQKLQHDAVTANVLHQGIAGRDFTRTFALPDDVHVRGAELKNGLLSIGLERIIPEHMKPKRIEIGQIPPTLHAAKKELLTEKE